ncbi:MAG TPA: MarR family transcriptional regulator [bacterium]|jgi:DNA-binding MarR family transcriptional regulator
MKSTAFDVDLESRAQLLIAFPRILIMAGEITARAGDALIFEEFGLNVAKFSLLATLSHCGGQLSMSELKDQARMMRSQSNLTQMVDDLEARHLLQRISSKEDRRVSLVEITDEGRALTERVMVKYFEIMDVYLKDFPTNELRDTVMVMIKWIWKAGDAAGVGHLRPTPNPFDEA